MRATFSVRPALESHLPAGAIGAGLQSLVQSSKYRQQASAPPCTRVAPLRSHTRAAASGVKKGSMWPYTPFEIRTGSQRACLVTAEM